MTKDTRGPFDTTGPSIFTLDKDASRIAGRQKARDQAVRKLAKQRTIDKSVFNVSLTPNRKLRDVS